MAHNQFNWYEYKGRGIRFTTPKSELSIKKNHVVGIRTISDKYYVTDVENKVTIRIDVADMHRIVGNSKGFTGIVKGVKLRPGVGALDKREREEGYVRIDSGMFTRGKYDAKRKTLTLEFRNGAVWEYSNVSAKEVMAFEKAKSQGSFFNEVFKGTKESHRMTSLSSDSNNVCTATVYFEEALPTPPSEIGEDIVEGERVTMSLDGKQIQGCVVGSVEVGTGDVVSTFGVFTPILPGAYLRVPKVPLTAITRDTYTAVASSYSVAKHGLYEASDLPAPPEVCDQVECNKFERGSRVKIRFNSSLVEGCVVNNFSIASTNDGEPVFEYSVFIPTAGNFYTIVREIPEYALEVCGCGPTPKELFNLSNM
jgi:hypothetical protein